MRDQFGGPDFPEVPGVRPDIRRKQNAGLAGKRKILDGLLAGSERKAEEQKIVKGRIFKLKGTEEEWVVVGFGRIFGNSYDSVKLEKEDEPTRFKEVQLKSFWNHFEE